MNNINQAINEIRSFGKYGSNVADGTRVQRTYIKKNKGLNEDLSKKIDAYNNQMKADSKNDARIRNLKLQKRENSYFDSLKSAALARRDRKRADESMNKQLAELTAKLENERQQAYKSADINKTNRDKDIEFGNDMSAFNSSQSRRGERMNREATDLSQANDNYENYKRETAERRRANRQAMRDAEGANNPAQSIQEYKNASPEERRAIVDQRFKDRLSNTKSTTAQNALMDKYISIRNNRKISDKESNDARKAEERQNREYQKILRKQERDAQIAEFKNQVNQTVGKFKEGIANAPETAKKQYENISNNVQTAVGKGKDLVNNFKKRWQTGMYFSVLYDRNTRSFSVIQRKINDTREFAYRDYAGLTKDQARKLAGERKKIANELRESRNLNNKYLKDAVDESLGYAGKDLRDVSSKSYYNNSLSKNDIFRGFPVISSKTKPIRNSINEAFKARNDDHTEDLKFANDDKREARQDIISSSKPMDKFKLKVRKYNPVLDPKSVQYRG